MSCILVEGTINGNLTVEGTYENDLNKVIQESAVIGSGCTGWPVTKPHVTTYEELVGYLDQNNPENDLITEIIIEKPIKISVSQNIHLMFGFKKIKVIDGFWDNNDAAIILEKPTDDYVHINISGAFTPCEFIGETNASENYFIKSTGVGVFLNNAKLSMGGALNAISIQNAGTSLSSSSITVSSGYAVDVNVSTESAEAMLILNGESDPSTINGSVRYTISGENGTISKISLADGASIIGDLTVIGSYGRLNKEIASGCSLTGLNWSEVEDYRELSGQ